jgi:hypothetical protein
MITPLGGRNGTRLNQQCCVCGGECCAGNDVLGTPGAWSASDARKDALLALAGGVKEVVSGLKAGVEFVRDKNLPVGSFALNGVLTEGLDIAQNLNNVIFQVPGWLV